MTYDGREVIYLDLSEKLKFNLSKSLIDSLYRKSLITIDEKDKILHKLSKKYNIDYEFATLT
ncbi:MAG: hypothetical protein GX947_03070 [Tissierellia bacterium]|nr:hypothetical protein [Tissierellia bacterium]